MCLHSGGKWTRGRQDTHSKATGTFCDYVRDNGCVCIDVLHATPVPEARIDDDELYATTTIIIMSIHTIVVPRTYEGISAPAARVQSHNWRGQLRIIHRLTD